MDLKDSEERSDREGERKREGEGGRDGGRMSKKDQSDAAIRRRCLCCSAVGFCFVGVFYTFIGTPAGMLISPEC